MAASLSDVEAELRARLERDVQRRQAASDPIAFARLCGIEPDTWQREALSGQHRRLLLNCCRQSGKSTTAAALALHRAIYRPGSLVLLISPSLRQSGELLRKVRSHARGAGLQPEKASALSMEFDNGSRIVSLPASEDTIRGFSAVSLIIEDEAAFVPEQLHDAVRPMLMVSNGDMVLMSTPNGRRGHFFEAWERGGPSWRRIRLRAYECPRIDPAVLAAEREDLHRRGLGAFFRQEYEGEFIDAAGGRVYAGFDETRNLIDERPESGEWTYALGIDFGIVDPNALTVVGWRKHDACLYILESYPFPGGVRELGEEVIRLDQKYAFSTIVGDTGGMGKAFQDDMVRYRRVPVRAAEKHNKLGHIAIFNAELGDGRVKLVRRGTEALRAEWATLSWAEGARKEAEGPNHCADACLYVWHGTTAYAERTYTPVRVLSREEAIREDTAKHWDETEREIRRQREEEREWGDDT